MVKNIEPQSDKFTYSVHEIASMAEVNPETIFRLIKRGELKVLPGIRRNIRVPKSEMERFFKGSVYVA